MNIQEFKDKIVIITGAAQGIGRTTAQKFEQYGAKVLKLDIDFSENNLEKGIIQFDVTQEKNWIKL